MRKRHFQPATAASFQIAKNPSLLVYVYYHGPLALQIRIETIAMSVLCYACSHDETTVEPVNFTRNTGGLHEEMIRSTFQLLHKGDIPSTT